MTELPGTLRVLVVESDEDTLYLLGQQLRLAGHACVLAGSAARARDTLASQPVDVVVAEIALPGESGLDLLRWVRQRRLPCEVILLTAHPEVATAIEALRHGAADYLTKPVTRQVLDEALARVGERLRAARQRQEALNMLEAGLRAFTSQEKPAVPEPAPRPSENQFRIGPVLLDLDRFVIEVNGKVVDATPSEIEILHYLCRNRDRVSSAQEIVESIRGYRVEASQAPELIRPHISNLRRKLLSAEAEADVVRTVRGVGYMLRVPVTKPPTEPA